MNPGRICLWRYRDRARNHPGYHLSADPAGCNLLLALLADLIKAREPQIGSVVLDPVSPADLAIPNSRTGQARVASFERWEILVDPRLPPEFFRFTVVSDRVRTELSRVQAESLIAGIEDIRERRGDYSIGDDEGDQLWFWWQEAD